ncbi:MAG: response regulator [Myxococcaceae bacterium]
MSYRALIVDDSPVVRRVVARALTMSGLGFDQLHQAANGKEALKVLEQGPLDVVFADINMPEMNGIELLEHMIANGQLPAQKVVVLSTERSEERIALFKKLGVRAYLAKPFKPEDLGDLVSQLLAQGAA